jgi:hypothetical protein
VATPVTTFSPVVVSSPSVSYVPTWVPVRRGWFGLRRGWAAGYTPVVSGW